jgi:hypothetical protein
MRELLQERWICFSLNRSRFNNGDRLNHVCVLMQQIGGELQRMREAQEQFIEEAKTLQCTPPADLTIEEWRILTECVDSRSRANDREACQNFAV